MVSWNTEAVDENGNCDFNEVKQSLRYVCPFCSQEWEATNEQLKLFNASSEWEATNEQAPQGKIGFHTTAFCFLDPFTLVTEWINAKSRAKDGDFSQLKIFTQKRLAKAWSEQQEIIETSTPEI